APNLPGDGRGIAIPRGATATLTILDSETEVIDNIEIAPAPPIPLETDDSPPVFEKDPSIYNRNAYYPNSPVLLSEPKKLRGVDFVTLGITPFQYNPVTKQLVVFKNIRAEVKFEGGYGYIGEDRLRNIHWEPVLKQNLINYESLPRVDFSERYLNPTDEEDVEYLIIVPDDPVFIEWADTIKNWRTKQGISTGIVTLTEIGGNSSALIEDYINEAYNTWSVPPAAFLLLSDYQNSGLTYGIDSPIWSSYCVSDNIYADVDGDELPDIAHSRMTAQNGTHLETMVTKFLEYERNPPTDPHFYQHPVTAGGWQTERWFILCTEICWGFMHNILEKDPVREYAIYSGTPGTVWSTNPNTYMLVDYFGPNGLGYIPETPEHLDDWGGNANRLNQDLNDGAFMLMHRDHGGETGWGEPDYDIGDLEDLSNEMLPFVFSINCLTGKYNWASACFAEVIHRMEHGALGIIAASEVSYSFVNDTYMLGLMDYLWPSFDPPYGQPSEPTLNPCFANLSGKWYLYFKDWPYNSQNKVVTYHLFHHFGDSYNTMFYNIPSYLDVSHSNVLFSGSDFFTVTANSGALIGLTVDNEIIGVGIGTGAPQNIPIIPQAPGVTMTVTVTKANYHRYEQTVDIIPPDGWGIAEGYITDGETADPLPGIVSVTNREPLLTTQAGSDGFYSLWIPADSSWNLRAEYGENYLPSFADVTVSENDTIQQDFQLELKVEVILRASFGNPDDINYRRFYARGSWDEDGFYNADWDCPFREMNDTGLDHDEVAGDGIFTGSVLLAVDLDHDYDWGVFFENYNDMHSFLQMGDDFGVTDPGNPPVVQTLDVNPSGGEHNWTLTAQGTNSLQLELLPGYEGIDYKWAGSVALNAGTTYDFCVYPMHFYEPFYGQGGPGGDEFTITPNYTEDITIIFSDNTDEIDFTSAHPRPVDIQATLDMDSRIDISWAESDVTPEGYKIYRSLYETGPFDSTGYTSHPTLAFSDMRVENYRDYWYYVTAIYPGDIESIPSEIVYGYAITGARLSVLPESFEVNVYPGSTLTANLFISNPGGLPLEYNISTGVESRLFDLPNNPEKELTGRFTIPDYDKTLMKPGYNNPPQPFDAGGPDAFGYTWIDSDEPGGPLFNWIDISEIGTPVSFSDLDDGNSQELPIGFDFEYYGNTFNGINLCTNGWASFTDSTCVEFGNMPIPHPEPPNNMLAVFYDD
ncbi:MAG: hypothetical protein GF307_06150, partial [candidate division Zixibacteria bacterium]|nr:hypothetical protein [candidate division Zixibacteria bacterium]